MILWSRPFDRPPGTLFCAVHDVDASVHTLCNGRWAPDARDEIRWEVDEWERCGGCDLMSREPRVRRDIKPDNVPPPPRKTLTAAARARLDAEVDRYRQPDPDVTVVSSSAPLDPIEDEGTLYGAMAGAAGSSEEGGGLP